MKNDRSQGCIINGEQAYMFVRNMQGDVIALADGEGNALVEYNYDPWGKITCTYAGASGVTDDTTLRMLTAILCPLTYRGYNYDFTTGLYYLQSRYYNPEWGRFLNCDDTSILLATKGETHGANMFAYCANNPVNQADYTGYWKEDVHSGFWKKKGKNRVAFKGVYIPINPNNNKKYGTYYWASISGFKSAHAQIIAEVDASVDDNMGWYFAQGWHFNTSPKDQVDSRIIIMTFMLLGACANFDEALKLKKKGQSYDLYLISGLDFLGRALHPAQDYYAHTDDRVYDIPYKVADEYYTFSPNPPFIIYHPPKYMTIKSHVASGDITDNVIKRWDQLEKTESATLEILSTIYNAYKPIFK